MELTVYYDGGCPLCRREIEFYRRLRGADRIEWVDAAAGGDELAPGLCTARALARLHVRSSDGTIISGARAFVEIWALLPRFRSLGLLFRIKPLDALLEVAYDAFLRVRPWLQRFARRATGERACEVEIRGTHCEPGSAAGPVRARRTL